MIQEFQIVKNVVTYVLHAMELDKLVFHVQVIELIHHFVFVHLVLVKIFLNLNALVEKGMKIMGNFVHRIISLINNLINNPVKIFGKSFL